MAVNPIEIHENGDVDVWHDEKGHGDKLKLKDINFVLDPNKNQVDERFIIIECPVCHNAVSTHPVSGGSAPEMVQRLFAVKFAEDDKSKNKKKDHDFKFAEDKVREMVEAQDGPGRFKLNGVSEDKSNIFINASKLNPVPKVNPPENIPLP